MKRKKRLVHAGFDLIGLAVAGIALFPLVWMVIAGFKSNAEVLARPFRFLPSVWHPENYADLIQGNFETYVFSQGATFLGAMAKTFGVAVFSLCWSLLLNSMAAYAFARLDFPFKRMLWCLYLIPWFVPGISVQIASFEVVHALGMLDTFWVLTVPGICYTYSIFFYRQFYLNIPSALEEAALLDGAGRIQIYTRIFLPMSATPFVVMGINVFLGYWNSYLWPAMTISSVDLFMVNQVIAYFRSSHSRSQQMIMAASSIAALPTILLFLCFQRYIMGGIKISGLK